MESNSIETEKVVALGGSCRRLQISSRSPTTSKDLHHILREIAVFSPNLGKILDNNVILGKILSRDGGL